jgi:hypothetical protein
MSEKQKRPPKPSDIPDNPRAHYTRTGEWKGWRNWLGSDKCCDLCGTDCKQPICPICDAIIAKHRGK